MLFSLQMLDNSAKGSKEPWTVVPAVALRKNGVSPLFLLSFTHRSNSAGMMRPTESTGTGMTDALPKP
jgi:hypothetical protein